MEEKLIDSYLEDTAKNISTFIKPFLDDIENKYLWKFDLGMAKQLLGYDFATEKNAYQQTVKLKALLVEKLAASQDFGSGYKYGEYFVEIWGGVRTNKALKEKLEPFYDQRTVKLDQLGLAQTLKGVSSWSKYLSLLNTDAAIYDSRVAYSINAINYIKGNRIIMFPMPDGRSPRLSLVDIESLFLLSQLSAGRNFITDEDFEHRQISARVKKKYYLDETVAYRQYLKMIGEVCTQLNLPKSDHFKIEMLLFALAPSDIFKALIKAAAK